MHERPLNRRIPLPPIGGAGDEGAAAGAAAAGAAKAPDGAPGAGAVAGAHAGAPDTGAAAPGTAGQHAGEDTGAAPADHPSSPPPAPAPAPVAPAPRPAPAAAPSRLDPAQIRRGQDLIDNLERAPITNSIDHDYAQKILNPAFAKGKAGEVPVIRTKAPSALSEGLPEDITGPMKDLGLDANDKTFRRSELRAADKSVHGEIWSDSEEPSENPISVILTSEKQRTLIAQKSFNDHYPPRFPEKDKIPQSELWFQQWKAEAPKSIPSLKYNIRQNIQNQDTQRVIEDANKNLNDGKLVTHKKVTFDPTVEVKPGAANPQKDAFMALAQTDNGRALFRMLSDHKQDFQGLKVVKVHTWTWNEIDAKDYIYPHMIWEMGT